LDQLDETVDVVGIDHAGWQIRVLNSIIVASWKNLKIDELSRRWTVGGTVMENTPLHHGAGARGYSDQEIIDTLV
jgi:hypothetical protein